MLIVFLLTWLTTLEPTASAQSSAVISGRILNAADGLPLPFVSIIVENAISGQQLTGTLSGENGRFTLQGLAPGSYKIRISFVGFFPAESAVLVSPLNAAYDLGDIRLPRMENLRQEITVTTDAIRAEGTDTQLFRLDESAAQSTGTLLDALKSLPGVTIDQEGKVLLRGSDRVAILIDGRQSSLTGFGNQRGLDSVAAANVEAIEIINNPSARFDAAGMAGIINIIYKKEGQEGFSGDAGFGAGMGQFTKQRADLPSPAGRPSPVGSFSNNEKLIPSLNLNHRTRKVRTFFQGDVLFHDDLPNNEFHTRFYDDGRVIESQVPENREQYHYTLRAGADWNASAATTMSFSGIRDYELHTDRAQVPFILQSTGQRERLWFWRERESTEFSNAAFNLKHRFSTPGRELGVNVQFTRGKEDEAYFLNEESPVRVGTDNTHIVAIENTLPLSVDYVQPLKTGRLEIGGKVQRRWIPVTYTVERGQQSIIYPGLGDHSNWDENIFAAYGNIVRVTPSYILEAGLRIEETQVSYTIPQDNIYYPGSDAYDYFELFPNVKLTYNLGGGNRVIGAYNRRVDRPGEPELRIFPKYDDPELLKVGNPFLRPQFTNVVEFGYGRSWRRGSAVTTLYHRDIKDAFRRIFAIDASNPNYDIINKIFENAGNSRQSGIELLVTQDIEERWRVSGSVNGYRNKIDALTTTLFFPTVRQFSINSSSDHSWDFKVSNQFRLPKSMELQANFIYYSEKSIPQGRELARSSMDISAKWPLIPNRAELQFTFSDIFNDFAVEQKFDGEGFTALYQNLKQTQVATLGLRVRF
jgi:hypothetical protein